MNGDDMTTFGNMQFRTVDACIDAICDSYMTSDGTTHPDTVREMLAEATDDVLVTDLLDVWALPHSREALAEGMARLRARFQARQWPQVYRDTYDEHSPA